MADLTARMPLTDGTVRVYDNPANPSMAGAFVGLASEAISGYADIKKQMSADAARQAAEKRRQRQEDSSYAAIKGYNQAVDVANTSGQQAAAAQTALSPLEQLSAPPVELPSATITTQGVKDQGVFTVPAVAPEAVVKNATMAGREVSNVMAAVDQGRMPPISLKAALNGKFNQLVDQFPDQAENILDVWKKMGIDTTLFREGKDLGDQLDEDREAKQRSAEDTRKFEQHMFEMGAEALGETMATGGKDGGPMTRDEVISYGLVTARQAHNLELQTKAITLQQMQTNLSLQDKNELEKDKNKAITQAMNNALYNGANPVINMVQNLSNSIMKEPDPAKQALAWQQMGTRLHTMIGNQIEHGVQNAIAGGFTGDPDALRAQLRGQFQRVEDLFTGDHAVAKSYLDALSTINTKLKIDGATALPVFTALRDLGMDPTTMTGFINGIGENKQLTDSLRDELKGFSADFGEDRASTHLMNIVHMLRGESTLADMSSAEARQKLPDLYNTTTSLVTNYARGLGGDPNMVMHGIGELSIAAASLTPSSGANAHQVAAGGILNTTQVMALKKLVGPNSGVDPAMAVATLQAARAGGAHVLNNFQANIPKLNKIDPMFQIKWNARNGNYWVDDSAARKQRVANQGRPSAFTVAGGQGFITGPAAVPVADRMPKEMERWVKAANMSLDGLIATRDNDPSTPKGTDLELREYYGRNIAPKSLKEGAASIDVNAEIDKQFTAIDRVIDSNLTNANRPVTTISGVDTTKPFRDNVPVIMQAEGTTAKGFDTILGDRSDGTNSLGVTPPKPVTQMTLGEAFKFGNDILRPASGKLNSSAMGGLQITATNIRDFGKKLFGADWQSKPFSQENQIKLAEAIHAAQGYGAWEGLKR